MNTSAAAVKGKSQIIGRAWRWLLPTLRSRTDTKSVPASGVTLSSPLELLPSSHPSFSLLSLTPPTLSTLSSLNSSASVGLTSLFSANALTKLLATNKIAATATATLGFVFSATLTSPSLSLLAITHEKTGSSGRSYTHCDAAYNSSPSPQELQARRSIFGPIGEQLSVGLVLGFATGYAIRRIGRFLMLIVGGQIVFIQYLAHKNWLTVHWDMVGHDLQPSFDKDVAKGLMDLLTYRVPFAASFSTGIYLGVKYGR